MNFDKNIQLLVALVLIVGVIGYIESIKSKPVTNNPNLGKDSENAQSNVSKNSRFNAPELAKVSGYVNTADGLKLSDLKGKVILVDFWTYSCINCIRTLPYLNAWYDKYHEQGLEIVGVHTPEFDFEKNYDNVKSAVSKYNIKYPVVLDNDYGTWQAYGNRYWPHEYIIDAEGNLRHDHIGEGGYEETEEIIQQLLKERDQTMNADGIVAQNITSNVNFYKIQSPEIYLGYQYTLSSIGNEEGIKAGTITSYNKPSVNAMNKIYLQGAWKSNPENIELVSENGSIQLEYSAKSVNIVAGGNTSLKIFLDDKEVDPLNRGSDEQNGKIAVNGQRLYNILSTSDYGQHIVKIEISGGKFQLYTFTFG